jgi:putative transcriptional regulator
MTAGPNLPALPIVTGDEIKALRDLLGLTQPEFSARYLVPIGSLRNWEQGRRELDTAGSMFFRLVAFNPDAAASALQYMAERHAKGEL